MQPLTAGEAAFHKRLKGWIALRKDAEEDPGVMVRTSDHERWTAWRAYFERHDCQRELARMRLCEQDRPYGREPGSLRPWMQVPSTWPREFDAEAADYAGRRG
jgi:hypothetical protein